MLSDGFDMIPTAERVLLEFGGSSIDEQGPGETCSREPFTIDPTLAAYEGDRFCDFSSLINTRLYPIGEATGGYHFLAIGENGYVYLMSDDIELLGRNIDEALESLLIGQASIEISLSLNDEAIE